MVKLIICGALLSILVLSSWETYAAEDPPSDKSEEDNNSSEDADPKKCPEGEVYSKCPTVRCPADYCPVSRDYQTRCPTGIVCDPPRCVCSNLKVRDPKTQKCIPIQNCKPFKCDAKRNEVYRACRGKCPSQECSDYVNNATCGPPLGTRIGIVVPCQPQCACIEGLYRNDEGYCVDPAKCPQKCKKNEIYSTCINGACRPLKCSQLGYPVACPRIREGFCIKGCICAEGYVFKDNEKKCIPANTCPNGCGGDPKSEPGCGNCGRTCEDYKKKDVECTDICQINSCTCKEGLVYDSIKSRCVSPKQCSKQQPTETDPKPYEGGGGGE